MRSPALLLLLLLPACAGRLDAAVRRQAATDFNCSESQVQLKEQGYAGGGGTFDASGCGQQATYQGTCGLFACRAYVPGTADAAAPADAAGPADDAEAPTDDAGSDFDGPSGGSAAPARSAGPKIVSVSIKSECSRSVRVFFGKTPKFGSGTTSSIGSNERSSKSMKPGDMIWLVDDKDNGLGSVTISESTRTVEIPKDCGSIRAR